MIRMLPRDCAKISCGKVVAASPTPLIARKLLRESDERSMVVMWYSLLVIAGLKDEIGEGTTDIEPNPP
jgi:hypothetical protein